MSVTSQLCEKIAGTSYADLGAPAIVAARRLVLDGIAIAIAGTEEEAIHILAAHFKEQELRLDPEIPGRFEEMHVLLRVELDDGRVLETRCDGPRGKWGAPPISEAEHLVKIRDCLATRLESAVAENSIEHARRIDDLDAAGVRQLMQLAGCFA